MAFKSTSGAAFFSRGFDTATAREDLQSQVELRQLSAMQHVIACMTIGKDMSGLFNEVAALTSSTHMVLKRLVYLYLMQNSRVQPEKAVLQAGSFVKDTLHNSPLIRGAALRTMTSLQLNIMADFAVAPIRRCLEDSSAYVRRIAVLAVLKQYHVASSTFFEYSLIDKVKEVLHDDNAAVAGAAVQVLLELHRRDATRGILPAVVDARPHLVEKLEEATEWAAYYLLEGIAVSFQANTTPPGQSIASPLQRRAEAFLRDGGDVMIRVLPFLFYANQATRMAAIKTGFMFLHAASNNPGVSETDLRSVEDRFAPCLVRALLSQLEAPRFEYRYVALRNIQLFFNSRLRHYFRPFLSSFLIKFGDPIYIKLEKLDSLVNLADDSIGSQVLLELVVYARETDVELVGRSIRAIGCLAATLPSLAARCVEQLKILIGTNVPHIVESAAVVVQHVLRVYPNEHLDTIPILCDALRVVDDVKARAAVIWLIGEYTDCVPDAAAYVDIFLEDFMNQPRLVQLGVLSALVKIYVRGAEDLQNSTVLPKLEAVLGQCVNAASPDLRGRALFYRRILASDFVVARHLFASEHRTPLVVSATVEHRRREGLLEHLGTIESVTHIPVCTMLGGMTKEDGAFGGSSVEHTSDEDDGMENVGWLRAGTVEPDSSPGVSPTTTPASFPLALGDVPTAGFCTVLTPEENSGVTLAMQWSQLGAKLVLNCRFQVVSGEDHVSRARVQNLQINRNMFALGVQQVFPSTFLDQDDKLTDIGLVIACNSERQPIRDLHVAVDIEPIGVRYFLAPPIPPAFLLLPATGCEKADFRMWWGQHASPAWSLPAQLSQWRVNPDRVSANALRVHGLHVVSRKEEPASGFAEFFLFAETTSRQRLLMELVLLQGEVVLLEVRSSYAPVAAFFGEYVHQCLSAMSG